MEPMNLLVVERDADWTQWNLISRGLGRAVLVLVQQADESSRAFHERITRRLQRGHVPSLNKVVLLGSARANADPARDRWIRQLAEKAMHGLRVYPHAHAPVHASELALDYALG
ncbi:MAG TPA: hypothetical protein VGF76_09490 [Polyangiaceae bacterium]